ncbi:MAG: CHAD domain-containing protein [Hyphomicrobium sp.]
MAYRFKLNEPIREGFLRIGSEQIERAERVLMQAGNHDTTIHETRKGLKRIRALLRLARPGLDPHAFDQANAHFRQLGALLSEARDNQIMLQTIAKLEAEGARAPLQGLKRLILAERDVEASGTDPGLTAAAIAGLRQARSKFESLKLSPSRFTVLRKGLERSYAHGRRAAASAFAKPHDEAFHELRKGAQLHWRHMQLLERAWPDFCAARIAAARDLSQILGDDHDLAVLKIYLKRVPTGSIGPAEARVIRRAVRDRQNDLREAARPRAQRLFAERPGDLARHIDVLWSSAKRLRDEERREDVAADGRRESARRTRGETPVLGTFTGSAN